MKLAPGSGSIGSVCVSLSEFTDEHRGGWHASDGNPNSHFSKSGFDIRPTDNFHRNSNGLLGE